MMLKRVLLYATLTVMLAIPVLIACLLGIRSLQDAKWYYAVNRNYKVGGPLWRGEIGPGYDAEKLLRESTPWSVTRFGRWIKIDYAAFDVKNDGDSILLEGLYVYCKDGRVAAAGLSSSTYCRQFFNSINEVEWMEYLALESKYYDELGFEQLEEDEKRASEMRKDECRCED